MKIMENLGKVAAVAAVIGMLSPTAVFGATPTGQPDARKMGVVRDVSLTANRSLHGQLVDERGNQLANQTVVLLRHKQDVARTTTDQQGRFAIQGLTGGTYELASQNSLQMLRVWSAAAAPPVATKGVLLVEDRQMVVNGQCADGSCGPGGYAGAPVYGGAACGPGGCGPAGCGTVGCATPGCGSCGGGFGSKCIGFLSNPFVIGAVVAAAIAIPLALDDDDDDGS